MHQRIEELEAALAEKAAALNQVRQQEAIARQMSGRMEEVFREFELLQQKYHGLEAQTAAAQEQALELEELQRAYNLMQKDLVRKQEKLEDLAEENKRLQLELMTASDKLSAAGQQHQQLSKRSRAVQEMQIDIAAISEGQSKLQQQLRHISELETMLEQFGTIQGK
jgi:chromosome segregation ATPase